MGVPYLYNGLTFGSICSLFLFCMHLRTPRFSKTSLMTAGALALVLMGAGCSDDDAVSVKQPAPDAGAKTFTSYKDGSYTAEGTYQSPADLEHVTVTVTLKDGVITDTVFAGTSPVGKSQRYMDTFSSDYKPLVVGKKLSDVQLTKVSGSSLTPIGFNNALEKIKQQAGQL
jgi:uncharacterized protein with FMN-binding domain